MKKAVDVVIIDKEDKFFILKKSSTESHYPGLWDLPGGGVYNGETLEKAVKREVKEETSLDVKIENNYFFVFRCDINPKIELFAFKAYFTGGRVSLSEEHTEYKWISKKECKDYKYTPGVTAIIEEFIKNKI